VSFWSFWQEQRFQVLAAKLIWGRVATGAGTSIPSASIAVLTLQLAKGSIFSVQWAVRVSIARSKVGLPLTTGGRASGAVSFFQERKDTPRFGGMSIKVLIQEAI
jgi:hypothetical protein